jgi:YHS domain-containing protein
VLRGILYFLYFLVILYFVRLVSRSLGRLFGPGSDVRRSARSPRPRPRQVEDLVHDRICNTHVPRSRALAAKVGDREEYFCSQACLERARAMVARAS